MKKNIISGIILAAIFVIAIAFYIYTDKKPEKNLTYNEFLTKLNNAEVSEVVLSNGQNLKVTLSADESTVYLVPNPRLDTLKETLLLNDCTVIESDMGGSSFLQSGIGILVFAIAFFVCIRYMRKQTANSGMALKVKDATEGMSTTITFSDIAGNIEAKQSVSDIVDFIKDPEKYNRYGARMPHGIIFYGAPGTGKTLMAKAIATEAGVPFFAVSGSDFVQMYVGVGASRVRDLFKSAKASKKAVIFIDEIDAIGKKRSATVSGSNDERDQTLNALLTEMSGFNGKEGIIVIAATNRVDILDEALLRPGRFDRQVEITLPDLSGREAILGLYAKNKPFSKEVDFSKIAKQTVYFSGAMLENLLNEAAILAAKDGSDVISTCDIDRAFYTIIAGSEKHDKTNIRENDRKITAYHESGHALVTRLTSPENTVSKVTIIPSTKGAGGFCVNIPPDKMYFTKKEMQSQIMISLAGRAAEEIVFGEDYITTGASNDIEKATAMIRDYASKYGMSEKIGLLNLDVMGQNSGKEIADECKAIVDKLYAKTKKLIFDNSEKLDKLAAMLLDKETLNEDDLEFI